MEIEELRKSRLQWNVECVKSRNESRMFCITLVDDGGSKSSRKCWMRAEEMRWS